MPRVNRREIFADDEIQVFHVISRGVRRTFLCGSGEKSGRDFSHRKQWIRDRLEVVAGIFAVDVLCWTRPAFIGLDPDIERGTLCFT